MSLETRDAVSSSPSDVMAVAGRSKKLITALCIAFTFITALVPVIRTFYRVQITYNEGWNVYNTAKVAEHQLLYPAGYSWTTVNYPALSFFIVAQLSHFTHEYLFTARVLSLLSLFACCILVGAIVRKLTSNTEVAVLAAFFCLALFATDATPYVGLDDPQMLAQAFFLAGFTVYVYKRQHIGYLSLVVLLFVIGGNVKHNLLEFPLAVFIDLLLVSKRRAMQFALSGMVLVFISIFVNQQFGGPFFVTQMLAPRRFSWLNLWLNMVDIFGPILVPALIALVTAALVLRAPVRRVATIFFFCALLIGAFFSGGKGVWINGFFGSLIAISISLGLFFDDVLRPDSRWPRLIASPLSICLVFGWLIIPSIVSDSWRPVHSVREIQAEQTRFDQEVATLHAQHGPAICESMLRCYFAEKPYIYDPFNSTRLIRFGKLNPQIVIDQIARHEYGAIQLDKPVEEEIAEGEAGQRFVSGILTSIQQNYVLALDHKNCWIYVPKSRS